MTTLLRFAFGIMLLAQALPAQAQFVFSIPSVPVGGSLLVQVTPRGPIGLGLPNTAFTMTVIGGCGTVNGSSSAEVTTNSVGLLSFTFGAGFVPGVCNVEGRSSAVAGTLAITVYRPSDVTLDVDRSVMNASVNSSPWLGHAYDSSQLQVIDVGPYSLKFNGGNAVLEYSVEGRSGTLSLTRQSPF